MQREALWIEYLNIDSNYPHALKVAVGKVNALSGEMWDETFKSDRKVQDYCVTPLQPWLDGCNCGDGYVKQFVAMPLGSGYSVEKQVTGEEKTGGMQIVCYNAKEDRRCQMFGLTSVSPLENNLGGLSLNDDTNDYYEDEGEDDLSGFVINKPTIPTPQPITLPPPPMHSPPHNMPQKQSMMVQPMMESIQSIPMMDALTMPCSSSAHPLTVSSSVVPPPSSTLQAVPSPKVRSISSQKNEMKKEYLSDSKQSSSLQRRERSVEKPQRVERAQEMSIALGGRMKQQILEDPYGAEFWDPESKSRVFVHLVNSEMYRQITGEAAPETPITAQTYSSYNYPWFDFYNEDIGSVNKSDILSGLKSVKEIDQEKHGHSQQDDSSVNISNVHVIKGTFNTNDVRDGDW